MIFTRIAAAGGTAGLLMDSQGALAAPLGTAPSPQFGSFTLQGLVIIGTLISMVVGWYWNDRKRQRDDLERQEKRDQGIKDAASRRSDDIIRELKENRKSDDERFREIESSVQKITTRMERFVPGDVIDGKIEHLKTNRVQIELRHEEKLKEINDCITEQGKQIAKMEERHHGMADTMGEMKGLMKDLAADMKAGFKEIADQQRKAA